MMTRSRRACSTTATFAQRNRSSNGAKGNPALLQSKRAGEAMNNLAAVGYMARTSL